MPEKKSPFAPKREVCAFCSGTGWANQRDIWSDAAQATVRQMLPGVVPCLCTQGHQRRPAYQKAVDDNCEQMRLSFGNNWREDFKLWTDKALAAMNPVEKRESLLF